MTLSNHQEHQGHQDVGAELDSLAHQIVDAGLAVHKTMGPGLLESAHEHCLAHELSGRGLSLKRQVPLPIVYKGARLDAGYRLDLVVQDAVIIEIKSVEALTRLHTAQVLTYLRLSGIRLGLLMNFNVGMFKTGVRRLIL
jgi:GxxExxY protein